VLGAASRAADGVRLGFCVELNERFVGVVIIINGVWNEPNSILVLLGSPLVVKTFFLALDVVLSDLDVLVNTEVGNEVILGVTGLLFLCFRPPVPLLACQTLGNSQAIFGGENLVLVFAEVRHEVISGERLLLAEVWNPLMT
jgi:hypothetical protein